jgi:hypothetical protein
LEPEAEVVLEVDEVVVVERREEVVEEADEVDSGHPAEVVVEVAEVVVEEVLREVAVVGGANLALGEVLESSLSLTAIPGSSLLEVEGKTCSSRRT